MYCVEINQNKKVQRIIVCDSVKWCEDNLGGVWVKTQEPLTVGLGFIYDESKDIFIPSKPYESWILDENMNTWTSPIPYPDDKKRYKWNENQNNWVEIESS